MKKRNVLLTTDLYHPHNDPNDHWNLATMYSLAKKKLINFAGIMCDEDKPNPLGTEQNFGDPSVQSIAQLNYISGIAVPQAVGSHQVMKCDKDVEDVLNSGIIIPSANMLISVLENSDAPLDIHLCGSSRDVFLAYKMRPELFTERVRIFLNAGTYTDQDKLEYNAFLEPYSFSHIFKIPCQVMWAPCFESMHEGKFAVVAEHANFYKLFKEDVIPNLSRQMKNFFAYMYTHEKEIGWLSYIRGKAEEEKLKKYAVGEQWMWSTPGFIMSAGLNIKADGSFTDEYSPDGLFCYKPVVVDCRTDGRLDWRFAKDGEKTNVKIFTCSDPELYCKNMAATVKNLLIELP